MTQITYTPVVWIYSRDMEKTVLEFLKKNQPKFCVISTVSEYGTPECAVMAYVVHEDLTITFSTPSTSRKWHNLEQNPYVAFTTGWEHGGLNVQYQGRVTLIALGKDHQWHEEIYFKEHPELAQFRGAPGARFIKITPTWIRLTDYTKGAPQITEQVLK